MTLDEHRNQVDISTDMNLGRGVCIQDRGSNAYLQDGWRGRSQ